MNGLNENEVIKQREKFGYNRIESEKKEGIFSKIINVIKEPMFLLLLVASAIYFLLGEAVDGLIMLVFIVGIISIDTFQELKTDRTIDALKKLSSPKVTVIRNGKMIEIDSELLVPDDIMFIKEGDKISADGIIIKNNGLCTNEGLLTGESVSVWKTTEEDNENYFKKNYVYKGTTSEHGSAYVKVTSIGVKTEYGKIGENLIEIKKERSNLQKQIDKVVYICTIIALVLFLLVLIVTFFVLDDLSLKERIIQSILSGITLAMCMIPEEFPVVLTVFLSMGAYRLAKKQSLIRNLNSVETLGAVSTLCVDKTGTITMNQMEVSEVWPLEKEREAIKMMTFASELDTFDSMEKEVISKCKSLKIDIEDYMKHKEKEYPFNDDDKMMGIIRKYNNKYLLSVKGSIESVLKISEVSKDEENKIISQAKEMSERGLRVLGVSKKEYTTKTFKESLYDERLDFVGLVGFIDPPRENIEKEIDACYKAGIRIIMITGDNGFTASSIASKVGIKNSDKFLTGEELHNLSEEELRKKVKEINIYSRVIPEDKYRIVKALKENGEIVAMTGDGVNDAPALKYADIGISMSKRGSEVAREASDLILLNDDFKTITHTVKDGRRIYSNIVKAIGYIFTIHIPIALIALVTPLAGITGANLMLLPVHIVLLELIIDPTCSIVLERQPAEAGIMNRRPRKKDSGIISKHLVFKSFVQAIFMFISSFGLYYLTYQSTNDATLARTMGLITIMLENYFLVIVNTSTNELSYKSFIKLLKDKLLRVVSLVFILMLVLIMYTPLSSIVKLTALSLDNLSLVIFVSFLSIFWFDLVKILKGLKK